MRSDSRTVAAWTYGGVLLFNGYALGLYAAGQLTLYIHPRYVLFTVILCAASALVCCAGLLAAVWRLVRDPDVSPVRWRPSFTVFVAAVVLVVAYALPARPLSSDTADQRIGNFNSARSPAYAADGTLAVFESGGAPTLSGAATAGLSIEDWVSVFQVEPKAEFYEGKDVDVVGFVFQPEGTPEDVFYVSRFVVTCCAVDARPIGLPVRLPGWRERFEDDDWVRVAGPFAAEGSSGVAEAAIVEAERVTGTKQPRNPYVN